MGCEIRAVRPEDWPQLKSFRLAALRDPLSRIAFEARYEQEVTLSDEHWQRRAAGTSFVAVDPGGDPREWVGSVTVLTETGPERAVPQTHVVGMYVRPEQRGTGVAERLLRTAVAWSWEQPEVARVRLWVTGVNGRAVAFYRRVGFTGTGRSAPHVAEPELMEYELAIARPAS